MVKAIVFPVVVHECESRTMKKAEDLLLIVLEHQSFSFSIGPSKEIPGLVSFRMDWLDLFAVQGTLKNLLQHHSS